jgi:hypothetical protein
MELSIGLMESIDYGGYMSITGYRYPTLHLPCGVRMQKWRKQIGLHVTHMLSRKARAMRYQDKRGVRK